MTPFPQPSSPRRMWTDLGRRDGQTTKGTVPLEGERPVPDKGVVYKTGETISVTSGQPHYLPRCPDEVGSKLDVVEEHFRSRRSPKSEMSTLGPTKTLEDFW